MATRIADRPLAKKSSKTRVGVSEVRPRRFTTLMGFTVESEPMPDNPSETLYTLTHRDLPGMVLGDSDPWQALLCGLDAASHMLRQQMEAGEKLPMQFRSR